MSKMDALRAMREARHAAAAKGPARPAPVAARPKPAAAPTDPGPTDPAPTDARCGHKAIGGRTCTRDAGHSEKSHRYS